MPRGNAMAPPKLARNAPVVDVGHPFQVNLLVVLRRKAEGLAAIRIRLHGSDREAGDGWATLLCRLVDSYEPLRGEARLDHGLAARAVADGVEVIARGAQQALDFQVFEDFFACDVTVEAGIR